MSKQLAWLIEITSPDDVPVYLTVAPDLESDLRAVESCVVLHQFTWTKHAERALLFARACDARAYLAAGLSMFERAPHADPDWKPKPIVTAGYFDPQRPAPDVED